MLFFIHCEISLTLIKTYIFIPFNFQIVVLNQQFVQYNAFKNKILLQQQLDILRITGIRIGFNNYEKIFTAF